MSLKCVKCGKVMNRTLHGELDAAGVCIKCAREGLTTQQERELERYGKSGFKTDRKHY